MNATDAYEDMALDQLAAQVRAHFSAGDKHADKARNHGVAGGKLLIRIKAEGKRTGEIRHGTWTQWLADHDINDRTAQRWMKEAGDPDAMDRRREQNAQREANVRERAKAPHVADSDGPKPAAVPKGVEGLLDAFGGMSFADQHAFLGQLPGKVKPGLSDASPQHNLVNRFIEGISPEEATLVFLRLLDSPAKSDILGYSFCKGMKQFRDFGAVSFGDYCDEVFELAQKVDADAVGALDAPIEDRMNTGDAWQTLGMTSVCSIESARAVYQSLARKHHPDKGGDPKIMSALNRAKKELGL